MLKMTLILRDQVCEVRERERERERATASPVYSSLADAGAKILSLSCL